MNLLEQVITELNNRKGSWPQIAQDTEVGYSWLTKLARNRIPNPGIHAIQKLHNYLFPEGSSHDRRSSDRRANRRGGND